MENKILEFTKTEPNCAIKFGEIENTEIGQEIINAIKEKLDIDLMLCYLTGENLECHLRNPNRSKLENIISDKNEFFGIINSVLAKNNLNPIQFKSIHLVDFDLEAVSLLLVNSVTSIKKFISKEFNTDTEVFYPRVEDNNNILNHHIVINSKKDLDNITNNNGITRIKERFSKYLSEKDFWNAFKSFKYSPVLVLSSDLNKDQQFHLGFYGL